MILIKDKEDRVPFVREMLVESLTKAGMKPWQAHSFSKEIEDELLAKGEEEMDHGEFEDMVHERLVSVNKKVAERFKAWKEIRGGERDPIIILIGGGTGVGTTTVGSDVAHRMGIKNIIATDSVREVMRKTISDELMPTLHSSSFDAYKHMKTIPAKEKERVLAGFREQLSTVSVGIEAIIERALKEGTPTLIEGLHIVPGFINPELVKKHNVIMFVLHLKEEKEHKDRLYTRAFETKFRRSVEGYMENFKGIREIQKFITKKAESERIEIIENSNAEKSVMQIIDSVIEHMVKQTKKEENA